MRVGITHLYNSETFELLKKSQISAFTFDLRPTSLQFIQEYKLHELLKKFSDAHDEIRLNFENEKDFVIKNLSANLIQKKIIKDPTKLSLVFSDFKNKDYYEQFKTPYYVYYDSRINHHPYFQSKFFQGFIFTDQTLNHLNQSCNIYHFFQELVTQSNQKKLIVLLPFKHEMPESFFDFLPFDEINFQINSSVEQSYRNMNYVLLDKNIKMFMRYYQPQSAGRV